MKRLGLPVRVLAAHLKCTPQHLGAVLSGRSRMTDSMQERIEKKIMEICFDCPMPISFTIKAGLWRTWRASIPDEIDIEETLRGFIEWLAVYFYFEKMPLQEFIEWEREEISSRKRIGDGPYTREIPLFAYFKAKNGEKARHISIAASLPGNARASGAPFVQPDASSASGMPLQPQSSAPARGKDSGSASSRRRGKDSGSASGNAARR